MTVAIAYDDRFLDHDMPSHPENAGRLRAIVNTLQQTGQFNALPHLASRSATPEEVALVHEQDLVTEVEQHINRGGGWIDADTYVVPSSWEVALLSAGAALEAAERVATGDHDLAFCLSRPPGHHATPRRAMGFCLLNNVAIAARLLQQKYGVARVAIVDFDVHHGNGTQDAFWSDRSVLYLSTHQYPFYPGTGHWSESGAAEGAGTTVNASLPAYCRDEQYALVFDELFAPLIERYQPEFLLVSAGFDSHENDPLAMENLSSNGYVALAGRVRDWARQLCDGNVVFVLEGGYDYQALGECVSGILAMLDGAPWSDRQPPESEAGPDLSQLLATLRQLHSL
jgi:acetoin utilization deacetylase AcuC-like enzyme